jgi:hypothetical protein
MRKALTTLLIPLVLASTGCDYIKKVKAEKQAREKDKQELAEAKEVTLDSVIVSWTELRRSARKEIEGTTLTLRDYLDQVEEDNPNLTYDNRNRKNLKLRDIGTPGIDYRRN